MAEKEKRIFIGFINPEGDSCPVPYGKCNSLCDNCQGGMTRQEAIESMAKEMARLYCPEKPTKKEFESIWKYELLLSTQKHFKELAEAALNALLED